MKKYFLLVFLLTSLTVTAQVQKTVTFDFNSPSTLNTSPVLIPNKDDGGTRNVTNTKFTNEDVQLSFELLDGGQIGGQFCTQWINDGKSVTYYLTMGDRTHFVVSGLNGAKLNSISYPYADLSGDLYLVDNNPGTFDAANHLWTCGSDDASKVIFQSSGGSNPEFHQLTVTYTMPSDVLIPSYSFSPGSSVQSFKELTLTFDRPMSIVSTSGISISNGVSLSTSVSGRDITLSVPETINTDGSYTITVPAKCFRASDGYENAAISFTFNVSTPKNTLLPEDISPADRSEVETLNLPTLTFSRPVKVTGGKGTLSLVGDNEPWATDLTFNKKGNKEVTVSSETITEGITDKGVFVVTIPEGVISDGSGTYHNPTIKLTYYVGGEKNPNKGDNPQPPVEDTPTMKAAKALVADERMDKAGYPSKKSSEYTALQNLTTSEIGTTEEDKLQRDNKLKEAMENLYKSTHIALPEEGKYYRIFGQNASGKKIYLAYSDGSVSLTDQASSAASFGVEAKENAIALTTADGKYLQVLNANYDYDCISESHVSDSYTTSNSLAVSRLYFDGIDPTATFGLVSMFGSLGKGLEDDTKSAYSMIRYDNPSIPSKIEETVVFTDKLSVAFGFEETSKQENPSDVVAVKTTFTLEKETISQSDKQLVVTVANGRGVAVSKTVSPVILDKDKKVYMNNPTFYASGSNDNSFIVIPTDCSTDGTYYLSLPEGVITYTLDGKKVKNMAETLKFVVGDGSTPPTPDDTGKFQYFTSFPQLSVPTGSSDFESDKAIKDIDLNNIIFTYSNDQVSGLASDKTVKVNLYNFGNIMSPKLVTTGHFEKSTTSDASVYALKVVWDDEIKENSLGKSVYAITYPDATFGDANFEKWLADPSSVKKSDCHVNKADHWYFSVDNANSTSIDNIKKDDNGENVIYDLQGRRVERVTKTGVYIVNGKKTVIRK